jgi:histidine triad (HIT) family protein
MRAMGETTKDCLFCTIASGQAEADVVHRADGVVAFRDIAPRAPVHVLVVPTRHISSAHDLTDADADLLAACFRVAREVAEHEGIAEGYRVATNIGAGGGQAIPHLHLHVIGGRRLGHIDSGAAPG